MPGNLRRDLLPSMGDAAVDPSIVPDGGGNRDAVRYWPALDQRDDLGGPSDRVWATSMSAETEMTSIPKRCYDQPW